MTKLDISPPEKYIILNKAKRILLIFCEDKTGD